jgi:hypothetical protein
MADSVNLLTPGELPADFRDQLVPELLIAPDAQYVLARSAWSAITAAQFAGDALLNLQLEQFKMGRLGNMGMAANMDAAMSMGMGGPLVLQQMTYPDFFRVVLDPSQARDGMVIKVNRPKFLNNTKTEASRIITPNDQIFGGGSQVPAMEQVDLVVREYFGPTDANGNKSPLNAGQFTRNRAMHDILKYMGLLLRQDWVSLLDSIIHQRLINAALNALNGPGGTNNNVSYAGSATSFATLTGQGAESLSYDVLVRAVEAKKGPGRFAPGVGDSGKYVYFADIHQIADLKLDPQFQRLSVFEGEKYNPLFPGYFRTIENLIVVEDNNMPRVANQGVGSNVTAYQGLIVAPGVMGLGVAKVPTPLRDPVDDGGRMDRFAWHCFMGLQCIDDRFVQLVVSD